MATGQDIVNVKQYLTFYDVTGLIDSEKRYYYVPLKEEMAIGQQTCLAFLSCLNNVCPPPMPDFVDIEISRWNPNDRELVVKANIDVFTKGSSSHVLNYLIVKREMYFLIKPSIYYDAFFIRSATQTGMGSVRLSLESDDFTNAFYLHNNNVVVAGEEPFNDLIKNACVERQHYDRFTTEVNKSNFSYSFITNKKLEVGKKYKINKINQGNINIHVNKRIKLYRTTSTKDYEYLGEFDDCKVDTNDDSIYFGSSLVLISGYINESYFYFIEVLEEYTTNNPNLLFTFEVVSQTITKEYYPANMDLFTKTNESFSFRQQLKSERRAIVVYKSLNYTYIDEVPLSAYLVSRAEDVPAYLDSLNANERNCVVSAVVKYMHILTRDKITYPSVMKCFDSNQVEYEFVKAYYGVDYESDSIPSAQQHLVVPFVTNVKGLDAFYEYFKNKIFFYVKANYLTTHASSETYFRIPYPFNQFEFTKMVNKLEEMFGYYIQSIYVTPYSGLSKIMDVEKDTGVYWIKFYSDLFVKDSAYAVETSDIIDKEVDTYSDNAVNNPTMVFIPKEIPQIEYPYETQGVTGNQFLDGLISAIDYYTATWNRKNLKAVATFKDNPSSLFKMEVDNLGNPPMAITATQISFGFDGYNVGGSFRSYYENLILCPAFIVGDNIFDEVVCNLEENVDISDLLTSYYEPILNVEPYELNTLSFLNIESAIQKKRLMRHYTAVYNSGECSITYDYILKHNQVVNNQFKMGIIPSYYEDGQFFRNYNDALTFISSDGLTIRNNSYYDFTYQQQARMTTERFLTSLKGAVDIAKYVVNDVPYNIGSGILKGGWKGAIEGAGRSIRDVSNQAVDYVMDIIMTKISQETELAGAGAKADNYSSAGTNLMFDINNNDFIVYRNKYKMDSLSYNSIAKSLERYGYRVDIYDKLNVQTRKGWDYVKLVSFDICETKIKLSESQEETLNEAFRNGVTLIHDISYINEEKHNIEIGIDEED